MNVGVEITTAQLRQFRAHVISIITMIINVINQWSAWLQFCTLPAEPSPGVLPNGQTHSSLSSHDLFGP